MIDIPDYLIIFPYFFLILFLFSVAGYLLLRRVEDNKSLYYSIGLLFQILWIFSYIISAYSPEIPDKVFWDTIIITSLVGILVCYLLFSFEFNGISFQKHKLVYYSITGIFVVLIIPIFIFIDHPAFRTNYSVYDMTDDLSVLLNDTGWYLETYTSLSSVLAIIPMVLFTRNLFLKNRSSLVKKQSIMIIASFSIIIFQFIIFGWSNILNLIDYLVVINLGCFAAANILIFIAVFPLETFELLPFAKNAILNNIGDGYCIYDKRDKLLEINQKLLDILGIIDRKDYIGKDPVELFYQYPILIEMASSNSKEQIEIRLGNSIFQIKKVKYYRGKQRYKGYILIFHDITTTKEQEENLKQQFQHVQKLDSVGRLAGGIAHEFNNLLTIILGNTQLMQLKVRNDKEDVSLLGEISDAASNASRLTKQLLAIGRKNIIHLESIDVNNRLVEIEEIFHRLIGKDTDIDIILDLDPACDSIRVDMGILDQILVNLVINARDAMPKGGTLRISTHYVHITEKNKNSFPEAKITDSEYICIAVSDTGIGMSEEIKNQLFEPFFTTKPRGKGTGLGLSMVYGAVQQFQGFITVKSEENQGSTFSIYFPSCSTNKKQNALEIEPSIPRGNRELIIIVEDDLAVRHTTAGMLKRLNYEVLSFSNGSEAINYFKKQKRKIDLLFTDVVMQGIKGNELAKEIKNIDPKVNVLFASGYTDNVIAKYGIIHRDTHFLAKPFTIDTLAQKIYGILHPILE
jgi:signal transduction histidine kinase